MSEEQFSVIIDKYQTPVVSLIYKMVSSWETARDLAQDTFVKLWNYRNNIKTDLPSFTLIYKIAMNISIDFLRKKRPEMKELDPEILEDKGTNQKDGEFYRLILLCTIDLKPKQKAIFILRDIEGFSFDEIVRILNTPLPNIRSNLHLARKNVKRLLESKYDYNEELLYDL